MADFFNKLKKSIDKNAAIVSTKSTTMIEVNKLKSDIASTNKLVKDITLELGTKVYTLQKEGEFSLEALAELIAKIDEANDKVAALEQKIVVLQNEEQEKLDEIKTKAEAPEVSEPVVDAQSQEVEVAQEVVETAEVVEEVVEELVEEKTE